MRRILLVAGLLVVGGLLITAGCASIPHGTYERLKFWKHSEESPGTSSLPNVQEEQNTVDTLNSFVRGSEVELPRGAR